MASRHVAHDLLNHMGYEIGNMLALYFYINAFPGPSMAMENLVHIYALLRYKGCNPRFNHVVLVYGMGLN